MARRPRLQRSIYAFTAVGKPAEVVVNNKKRKQDPESFEDAQDSIALINTKRQKVEVVISTPKPTKVAIQLVVQQNPSKSVGAKRKRCLSPDNAVHSSPVASSPLADTEETQLEDELQDLERLCTAFLSALSVHHAHGGSSSTIDLRMLTPSVTKAWGVRKVELVDIRRVLGLMQATKGRQLSFAKTFGLKDYGGGKVCIELKTTANMRSRTGRIIDETALKAKFKENLDNIWRVWLQDFKADSSLDYASFLDRLPLEALPVSATNKKVTALASRGQRRLEEVLTPFKRINISDDVDDRPTKRSRKDQGWDSSVGIENTPPEIPQKPADRAISLLERIKAKEAFAQTLPAGPTKEQRDRMGALQRSQEFLQIVHLLAVAKGGLRITFPLPSLIVSIQSSVRSPMSKEEIERCIKVLQAEVTPGHISMVTFGNITGVVVDMSRKPLTAEVTARLQALGV